MVCQYVTKLYKQHTTVVTSVPIAVRDELGLKEGDNLLWEVDASTGFVQLCKVVRRGEINARDKRNSAKQDKGRRT